MISDTYTLVPSFEPDIEPLDDDDDYDDFAPAAGFIEYLKHRGVFEWVAYRKNGETINDGIVPTLEQAKRACEAALGYTYCGDLVESLDTMPSRMLMESQDYESMFARLPELIRQPFADEIEEALSDPDKEGTNAVSAFEHLDRKIAILRETIRREILSARQILKRKDRIIWYLRLLRNWLLRDYLEYYPDALDAPAVRKYLVNPAGNSSTYEGSILNSLEHYLSLPIPEIQNYRFDRQTCAQVLDEFHNCEYQWKLTTAQDGFEDHDVDVLIDFHNGYKWVNTGRAACSKEGQSMGHCGNSPRANTNDQILSLRHFTQKNGKTFQTPCLTFIMRDDHALTEMKGRFNNKPAAKYHQMIVALLKDPYIHEIVGGGYLAENNFSLDDLTEAQRKEVTDANPRLLPAKEYYEKLHKIDDILVRKIVGNSFHGLNANLSVDDDVDPKSVITVSFSSAVWQTAFDGKMINSPAQVAAEYDGMVPYGHVSIKDFVEVYKENKSKIDQLVKQMDEIIAAKAKKKFDDLLARIDDIMISHGRKKFASGMERYYVFLDGQKFIENYFDYEREQAAGHAGPYSYSGVNALVDLGVELGQARYAAFHDQESKVFGEKLYKIFRKLLMEKGKWSDL